MTGKSCSGCGPAMPETGGGYRCFASKRVYSAEELARPWDCPFYCAPRPENGERPCPFPAALYICVAMIIATLSFPVKGGEVGR